MSSAFASFGGEVPPPELLEDLSQVAGLSQRARENLGRAALSVVAVSLKSNASALLSEHCGEGELAPFARVVSALRALYRAAASRDLSRAELAEDLAKAGLSAELVAPVLSGYELARARVASEIAGKTLAGHGRVLTEVDWRIAIVTGSKYGRGLKLPVVTLTLHWEEHGRRGATTYDLLPTMVQRLRDTLSRIVV